MLFFKDSILTTNILNKSTKYTITKDSVSPKLVTKKSNRQFRIKRKNLGFILNKIET